MFWLVALAFLAAAMSGGKSAPDVGDGWKPSKPNVPDPPLTPVVGGGLMAPQVPSTWKPFAVTIEQLSAGTPNDPDGAAVHTHKTGVGVPDMATMFKASHIGDLYGQYLLMPGPNGPSEQGKYKEHWHWVILTKQQIAAIKQGQQITAYTTAGFNVEGADSSFVEYPHYHKLAIKAVKELP